MCVCVSVCVCVCVCDRERGRDITYKVQGRHRYIALSAVVKNTRARFYTLIE